MPKRFCSPASGLFLARVGRVGVAWRVSGSGGRGGGRVGWSRVGWRCGVGWAGQTLMGHRVRRERSRIFSRLRFEPRWDTPPLFAQPPISDREGGGWVTDPPSSGSLASWQQLPSLAKGNNDHHPGSSLPSIGKCPRYFVPQQTPAGSSSPIPGKRQKNMCSHRAFLAAALQTLESA